MGASQSSYEDESNDNVGSEEKNEEWSITVRFLIYSNYFSSAMHYHIEFRIMCGNN